MGGGGLQLVQIWPNPVSADPPGRRSQPPARPIFFVPESTTVLKALLLFRRAVGQFLGAQSLTSPNLGVPANANFPVQSSTLSTAFFAAAKYPLGEMELRSLRLKFWF